MCYTPDGDSRTFSEPLPKVLPKIIAEFGQLKSSTVIDLLEIDE
jgi:hypothetical protein